jgi:hypothetical protein
MYDMCQRALFHVFVPAAGQSAAVHLSAEYYKRDAHIQPFSDIMPRVGLSHSSLLNPAFAIADTADVEPTQEVLPSLWSVSQSSFCI